MSSNANLKLILVTLTLLLFSTQNISAREEGLRAWRIKELASAPAQSVELKDDRNRTVGTVETKQMLLVFSAMTALMDAAEIYAELYVVEGKDPNAFATVREDEEENEVNMVGFTFGMLEMIGTDVDAAAAIIGHELAHLKLKHIDQKKEKIKNPQATTFSASATKYTRDNERDSDYLGAIWSVEAGYDPSGAVRVHEKLYKVSKRMVGFSGSHPSSIERVTILKSLARRLSK